MVYVYIYSITLLRTFISHENSSRISNLLSGCSKNCAFVFGRLHCLIMESLFGNDKFRNFLSLIFSQTTLHFLQDI
jgi:hypothetical protein